MTDQIATSETPPEKSVVEQLDELFAPWNRTDAPGLVVGVARDGAALYRRGFGMASLEFGVANTPSTRMRIGSTSKHFTCLLAMLLAEEGKLDIDAQIRTYIPELTGPSGTPTLRQLMQHIGGSRCYLDTGFIVRGMATPPDGAALRNMAAQVGRNFEPGETMIYNNGGYHLLSIAIERAGGAPFESQLKSRIFGPMRMAATESIPSDHRITPGVATLHVPGPDGSWKRGLFPSEEVRGEGAMVSTIDDMLTWMAHLRTRHILGSAQTWTAMMTPQVFNNGSVGAYALGLAVDSYRGLRTVHHAGGVIGGTCQMLTVPDEGVDVIIIANGAPGADVMRLAEQVVDIVLADRVGAEAPVATSESHGALEGAWASPTSGVVYTVLEEKGVLKLAFGKSPAGVPLRPGGEGIAYARTPGMAETTLTLMEGGEALNVGAGGRVDVFRRAAADEGDVGAFAAAAKGRYHSGELGAEAKIFDRDDALVLSLGDGHGVTECELEAVNPTLAVAKTGFLMSIGAAVRLHVSEGAASRFEVSTSRTRDLAFERA